MSVLLSKFQCWAGNEWAALRAKDSRADVGADGGWLGLKDEFKQGNHKCKGPEAGDPRGKPEGQQVGQGWDHGC